MAARVKRAAECEYPLELVTSWAFPSAPSSLEGGEIPGALCSPHSLTHLVQPEAAHLWSSGSWTWCWPGEQRNASFTPKNMEMEALLSKQNSPFCSASRENPLPAPQPLPQEGGGDRCHPPGLGEGCYWSASCFAPGEVRKWGNIKLCQGDCQYQPLPGPYFCRHSATSQQSSLPPTI